MNAQNYPIADAWSYLYGDLILRNTSSGIFILFSAQPINTYKN